MRTARFLIPIVGAFLLLDTFRVQAQTAGIEQELQKQYALTQVGTNGVVTQAGTVLVVQQDGIKAIPASYQGYFANTVKQDGRIKPNVIQHIGSGGRTGGSALHPPYLDEARLLQVGEKVYVTKVEIDKDTEIVFRLQSCGACDPSSVDPNSSPFRASVAFQFPKGSLTSATFKDVQEAVAHVLSADTSSTARTPDPPVAPLKLPCTFVSAQTPSDQLQLNADYTLTLQEGGQTYHGTFKANGTKLELNIEPNTKTTAVLEDNKLTDASGQIWVSREKPGAPRPAEAVLRNHDVIELAKAGIDDATILAKIASSRCQFDSSTAALIDLKKSGVSPAVIKAMVGAGK